MESPGGNGRPLRQLLDGLDAYRAKGVRFRIVVRSTAASAGAILVALGDERVASPGARLLFHGSRMCRRGQLSARECADLQATLSRSDDKIIRRLVDWAFAAPFAEPVHGAEPSDREVLERLCIGAVPDPEDTAPARIQTLASALGVTVDEALDSNDRESLAKLYARLFQIDRPISGKLARTLRLVDWVGNSNAGSAIGPGNPCYDAPEGIPFASPGGKLAPETLLRHVLVLGDHAGAATSLCLAPMVTALAKAPLGEVGPVLVLNPDPELRVVLHSVAQGRLEVLDPDRIVIDLMARDRSLASALESGRWMTAATSILIRTLDLVPASPARCLLDVSGRVVDAVLREGTHLAVSVVGFILMMMSTRSRCPEGWVPDASRDKGLGADLLERAQGAEGEGGPNVLALASWLLDVVPGLLPAYAAKEAIHALGTGGEARDVHRGLSAGGEALSCPSGRAWDVLSVAQAVVAPFAAAAARRSIYFGCEPGFDPSEALDLPALVSGDRDAHFVVIDPQDDGSDGLLAAGIKQLSWRLSSAVPGVENPPEMRPFVATSRATSSAMRRAWTGSFWTRRIPWEPSRSSLPDPSPQSSTHFVMSREARPPSALFGAPSAPSSSFVRPIPGPRSSLGGSPRAVPAYLIYSTCDRSRAWNRTRHTSAAWTVGSSAGDWSPGLQMSPIAGTAMRRPGSSTWVFRRQIPVRETRRDPPPRNRT